jgi:hypothetical protein
MTTAPTLPLIHLDYSRWRCGEYDAARPGCSLGGGETNTTMLLDRTRNQHQCCCVGLMFLDLGLPEAYLRGRARAADLGDEIVSVLSEEAITLRAALVEGPEVDSSLAKSVCAINDGRAKEGQPATTIPEKMAALTRLFRKEELADLQWFNVPDAILTAYQKLMTSPPQTQG